MEQSEARNAGQALRRVKDILQSNFLNAEPRWISEAAFALLMIQMKDALQILSNNNARIAFNEDVQNGDITKLISDMRNAICHIGSPLRHMDAHNNTLAFGVIMGAGVLIKGPDYEIGNPYQDDVAFFYGRHRILLKRHIHRAFQEADTFLRSKAAVEGWWWPF